MANQSPNFLLIINISLEREIFLEADFLLRHLLYSDLGPSHATHMYLYDMYIYVHTFLPPSNSMHQDVMLFKNSFGTAVESLIESKKR